MKKIFLLLFSCFFFSSCEKDDICDAGTPTTPKVVIEFFDHNDPSVAKKVTHLKVNAAGFTSSLTFNEVTKISIPLKTFTDISALNFILNGADNDAANDNLDEIVFNYTRKESFVSKACGYKTTFALNTVNPIVVTNDANNWLQSFLILQPTIENENETHVKIYF